MEAQTMTPRGTYLAVLPGAALLLCSFSLGRASADLIPRTPQEKPGPKNDEPNTWKILRASATNSCIAVVITAVDPSRPEKLGEYKTKKDAVAALEEFKKQDDPKKAGYKMCE
jgi:hypothetical protein